MYVNVLLIGLLINWNVNGDTLPFAIFVNRWKLLVLPPPIVLLNDSNDEVLPNDTKLDTSPIPNDDDKHDGFTNIPLPLPSAKCTPPSKSVINVKYWVLPIPKPQNKSHDDVEQSSCTDILMLEIWFCLKPYFSASNFNEIHLELINFVI